MNDLDLYVTCGRLKNISGRLDRAFSEKKSETPACAQEINNVIRTFLDSAASDMDSAPSFAEAAKAALKSAVHLARGQYERNMTAPLPGNILKQLQVFSLIQHPSADCYNRYQEIFKGYPSAREALVSKYNADANDKTDPYIPKDASGNVTFTPDSGMDYSGAKTYLTGLLKGGFGLIDAICSGDSGSAAQAQIQAAQESKTPVEMMVAVSNAVNDTETKKFLSFTDRDYRSSTEEESFEDAIEREYNAENN
jgi:hypothetical protein